MESGQAVPDDRVRVDRRVVERLQFVEPFLVPAFLAGQLAQLAVDERPRLGGGAFEHDACRLVDLRERGAKGCLLASRIKSLSRDLLVDVLAEQPLAFAREKSLV